MQPEIVVPSVFGAFLIVIIACICCRRTGSYHGANLQHNQNFAPYPTVIGKYLINTCNKHLDF